jgi:predicted O-methyltransferase YrrM
MPVQRVADPSQSPTPGRATRRLWMGLVTLLGGRPRGFFIPHRYADRVAPCDYPALAALLAAHEEAFDRVLAEVERLAPALERLGGPPPAPRFDQGWFAPLDACVAYAMVSAHRPRRIVEVGSGHSTRFLARAIVDQALTTALVCIDPAPRATLRGLPVRWHNSTVQEAPESWFTDLAAGDLLFIDSSHILMPGTDVDWLLNRILPALAAGVLIHVHDVFLPDPYPASWGWRGYNEQQALAALLQGRGYAITFASHYVAQRRRAQLADGVLGRLPGGLAGLASSLWLEKQG